MSKNRPVLGNDDAQLAVIVFFGLALAFIAFFWIVLGYMMDTTTIVHNNITQGSNAISLSQDRQNAMSFLQNMFDAWPVIAFIATILAAVFYGIANRNQTV